MNNSNNEQAETIELRCSICGNNEFELMKMLVNRRLSSLMNIDFSDNYIYGYVCKRCSHIEWFKEDVLRNEEQE